jgi:hypothetical protein
MVGPPFSETADERLFIFPMEESMSVHHRSVVAGSLVFVLLLLSLTGCPALFESSPPVASFEVTPSSGAAVGDSIILNGTTSSDPQGNALTYNWSLVGPTSSTAFLYPDYGPLVSFQADLPGQYTVVLTVTAGSKSSTASKTITVTGAASGITSFGFVSQPAVGSIDQSAKTITVSVPAGTDVTALVAIFTTTGVSITVNGVAQVSGTTPNNFTNLVTYVVTESNASTVTYTVTVVLSSTDPIVGKWQLSTMNGQAALTIPMAMNLTISTDMNWIAIGSQPGEAIVTGGTWSKQSQGNYSMTFAYGGPTGVQSMSVVLSGSTLIGTFTDNQGTETYVFIPGTAVLPDPIIGEWHLFSVTPAPATSQAMNFDFNSDKTWTMDGVQGVGAISASGSWNQNSPRNYTVTFTTGGPPGVTSMPFTMINGDLSGTFMDNQVQTTWILHTGSINLPKTANPLPSVFKTSNGDFAQDFKDQAWRLGPAADDDHWAEYHYMTFAINADGARYTEFLGSSPGTEGHSGYLNWDTSGTPPKLEFLDSNYQPLYSFTVLHYSANHLHLRMPWGTETREWIFSAGTSNVSGLVYDSSTYYPSNFYAYYKPLSGASVELGTYDMGGGGFTPIAGLTATTDARGFFEFSGLTAYIGQSLSAKVTKAGYQDYVYVDMRGTSTVTSTSAVFMNISLTKL